MKNLWLLILLLSYGVCQSQETAKDKSINTKKHLGPLFKHDTILNFTILANLKPLLKDRGEKPVNHAAMLIYERKKKSPLQLPIKLKVRGNFRRLPANCIFPPLLIDIDKKKKKNSVFDYQNRLKLITHCINEDYIFQEYLVYKMYNLITDYSFKARLARVTYKDSAAKRETETKLAFLLEDETDLAKRNLTKLVNLKQLKPHQLDTISMATLSVFEYMIGNTDWSLPFLHNIKLLGKEGSAPIPVPYDFDYSGIIEAKYAVPPAELEITSVRERLYRGIDYTPAVFQQVFDHFKSLKPQIYALYENNPNLKPRYIKRTLDYLDDFYETIDDPKAVKFKFIEKGAANQGGNVNIKGLK